MRTAEKGKPMCHIELTNEEQETLRNVLDNSLATLELEILHTDYKEFKQLLKRRREILQGLRTRIPHPLDAAA